MRLARRGHHIFFKLLMEYFDTKHKEDHHVLYQPNNILLPNYYIKPEIFDKEFSTDICSSKEFSQDYNYNINLDHVDHQLSFTGSSSSSTFISPSFFDPFDPFSFPSSNHKVDICDDQLNPFEEIDTLIQNNYQFGLFTNYNNHPKRGLASNYHVPINLMVPDEASSNVTVDKYSKTLVAQKHSLKKPHKIKKKSKSSKGQWTAEEDRLLIHMVEKYGVRKWSHIAGTLKGRIGKQCRERWHNHLRPDIKKELWSEGEDRVLIKAHEEVGNKWAEIAKRLASRTENSIKNHWNATKRRQYSRRKCRTKWPRPSSLLQNYIKSLNLEPKSNNQRKNIINASSSLKNVKNIISNPTPPQTTPPLLDETVLDHLDDHLVPEYDSDHIEFAEKLFEDNNIDELLEALPALACDHQISHQAVEENIYSNFEEVAHADPIFDDEIAAFISVEWEGKKELDLMEMINLSN